MGIFDRFFGASRRDSALPGPIAPVAVADVAPSAEEVVSRRMDSILNTLTGIGGTYDKGASAAPDTGRLPLTDAQVESLYRFNGYCKRYVDRHAEEATRASWKVEDDSDNTDPMTAEDERLDVVASFEEAAKWSRLYGGCVIFIVVDDNEKDLSKPISLANVKEVVNLVVLDKREASALEYDGDVRSANYRNVKYWSLSPARTPISGRSDLGKVHYSRVVYLPGNRLPPSLRLQNGGYDESVLQSVWDKARNLEVVDQAGAILSQEIKIDVLKVAGLSSIAVGDQAEYFDTRMKLIAKQKSLLGILILGDDEEFSTRSANISGYASLHDRAKEAFASVCDTPQTVMYGSAPSGLNTDGDSSRKNFDKAIARYQMMTMYRPLKKVYTLCYAAKKGAFKGVIPESFRIAFESLECLTVKERAELEKIHADTDGIRVEWGFVTTEHVTRSRYGENGYSNSLLPVEEADIEAANNAAASEVEEELRAEVERLKTELNNNEGGDNGDPTA